MNLDADGTTTTTKNDTTRTVLHVEIPIRSSCPISLDRLRLDWEKYFRQQQTAAKIIPNVAAAVAPPAIVVVPESLSCHVQGTMSKETCDGKIISTCTPEESVQDVSIYKEIRVYPYILSLEEAAVEELQPSSAATGGGDEERTACCESLQLPHSSLHGLWNNLIFDDSIKQDLLKFAHSALLFADMQVNEHIVHWNRLILLHGSPGTGKTSLCKALANKLAIRMGNRYKRTTLLEIQSHSLFSKWFSTSGKLVHRVFELVRDMVQDDPDCLVCVLIDEIESLASNRSAMSGNEPTDAMRAVNSLLTSLDRLRSYSNCLILATTNLTGSVDAAFMDRADMKVFVDLPGRNARYEILRSCLDELVRCGIIPAPANYEDEGNVLLPYDTIAEQASAADNSTPSEALLKLATTATGLSGRSLRRLPLQAHAYLHGDFNMIRFIETMLQVVEKNAQSDAAGVAPRSTTEEAEDLNQKPAAAVAATEGGIGDTGASPKRPPGRPPGSTGRQTGSTRRQMVNLIRRGRPKRTTADYSSSPSTTRARPTAARTQTSASLPVKRGPGRPRKDPVVEEEGVQEKKRKQGRPPKNAPSITVAKKGPGRPRKHAIVDGEEAGTVKKRGPTNDPPLEPTMTAVVGVPPDDPHNKDGLDALSCNPKRKRGRPSKTPLDVPPVLDLDENEIPQQKRKRGRPKGSASKPRQQQQVHDSDNNSVATGSGESHI